MNIILFIWNIVRLGFYFGGLEIYVNSIATRTVIGQELLQVHKIPFDKYQHLPSGNPVSPHDFLLIAC